MKGAWISPSGEITSEAYVRFSYLCGEKPEFAVEAQSLLSDIRTALRLDITSIRVINRYDADKITKEDFQLSVSTVFQSLRWT